MENLTDAELFEKLTEAANKHRDGHFTVMKFTTNWRVRIAFQFYDRYGAMNDFTDMPVGKTFSEAALKALQMLKEEEGSK